MTYWNSFLNNHSIKVRFITTLFVNVARVGLSFVAGLIIARGLGPANYGNFNFLLGSFASITALLDMGTSSAFYTFLSQKRRSVQFYLYYFLWLIIQFIIVLLLIGLIFPESWQNQIWLGHSKGLIVLAFLASFIMSKVWPTITKAGESIRATVIVQLHNVVLAGLYLGSVLAIFFLHLLTVPNLFIITIVLYLLFISILARRLKSSLIVEQEDGFSQVFGEFKFYCLPLVFYGIVSFVYSFADVWLLQKFGGAVQQGFFSVGLRFSSLCLIATTSMLSVFWKEIAEANKQGNKERLYQLYSKISRILIFVGAVGACFLVPFSREILVVLLGKEYEAGWICLAIMFLYPIHQSLGQVNGTYFFATTKTKLYSKIGIIMMLVSVPVAYFVLAPRSAVIPGLGLASIGLALKMVILQIITVNLFGYFIAKRSGWKFTFWYQFVIIAVLLALGYGIKGVFGWLFQVADISCHSIVFMILNMPVYLLLTVIIVYFFPALAGLERKEIKYFFNQFAKFFKVRPK